MLTHLMSAPDLVHRWKTFVEPIVGGARSLINSGRSGPRIIEQGRGSDIRSHAFQSISIAVNFSSFIYIFGFIKHGYIVEPDGWKPAGHDLVENCGDQLCCHSLHS